MRSIFPGTLLILLFGMALVATCAEQLESSAKILYRPAKRQSDTRTHWEKHPIFAKLTLENTEGTERKVFRHGKPIVFVVTMGTRRKRFVNFVDAPSRLLKVGYGIRLQDKKTSQRYELLMNPLWHYKLELQPPKPFNEKRFRFTLPNRPDTSTFGIVPEGNRSSVFDLGKGERERWNRAKNAWKNRLTVLPGGRYEATYDQRLIVYDAEAKQEKVIRVRSVPVTFEIRN